ncbi:hypothetical protein ACHQM5_000967 [Ranunculus cassubicifolius]
MEASHTSNNNQVVISPEDVIAKLKDDGDFDKLRLKIIQKLKENEELRNNIISTVKLSATLNRPGAENMKPRELSDAIHEEMGNQLMGQISDALWGVIKSSDGMKSEISETVESVYNRLLTPNKVQEPSPMTIDPIPDHKEPHTTNTLAIYSSEFEPKETPNDQQDNRNEEEKQEEVAPIVPNDQEMADQHKEQAMPPTDDDLSVPPGFDTSAKSEQQVNGGIEDDPDVPPGFG